MIIAIVHDRVTDASAPDEADVIAQAAAVSGALRALGHEPVTIEFSLNLEAVAAGLRRCRAELVFNLVEAVGGRGRLIHLAPALFESLHIPFTGARSSAMFTTTSKLITKRLLAGAGIPTPPWIADAPGDADAADADPFSLVPAPPRWIMKSVWEHASRGLAEDSVIEPTNAAALRAALLRSRRRLAGEGFAEAYIDGREFNLSILAGPGGPQVLPPAEIEFVGYAPGKPRIVGYAAKWDQDSFEYTNTQRRFEFPRNDDPLLGSLSTIAGRCWSLFGMRGYARVDFRVDQGGSPWVLEINANPCLSPDAGFAAAADRAGVPYMTAIARILEDA